MHLPLHFTFISGNLFNNYILKHKLCRDKTTGKVYILIQLSHVFNYLNYWLLLNSAYWISDGYTNVCFPNFLCFTSPPTPLLPASGTSIRGERYTANRKFIVHIYIFQIQLLILTKVNYFNLIWVQIRTITVFKIPF